MEVTYCAEGICITDENGEIVSGPYPSAEDAEVALEMMGADATEEDSDDEPSHEEAVWRELGEHWHDDE